MKNFFKLGFVALALSLSVVACNSENKAETTDTLGSDTVATDVTVVDTLVKTETDTTVVKSDTTVKH